MSMRGGRRVAFLSEEEKQNRPQFTYDLFKRITRYLRPYWKQFLVILFIMVLMSGISIMPSLLTGKIIDEGLIKQDLSALVYWISLSLIITIGGNILGVLQSYLSVWISETIGYEMRNELYQHIQSMSHRFFTSTNQGEMITRMTSDVSGIQNVIANTLTSIISNVLVLVVSLIAMISKNATLAAVGMVIVPLFVLSSRSAGKRRWSMTREAQDKSDSMNGILNETLSVSGQLLVKLFNKEAYEYSRYAALNKDISKLNVKQSMAGRWFRVVVSSFSSIGPMLIYLLGGILMIRYNHDLTVGDIGVLVALLSKMYQPINGLLNTQVEVIRSMALFTRLFDYLDMPIEIKEKEDAQDLEILDTVVSFDHVSFHYEKKRPILKDINFTLNVHESLAIVGPSGGGKSTIINLILRLYDATEGKIMFGKQDIKDITLKSLRDAVGVVTQDTYLFNGTILDNLLYANPKASLHEIEVACKQAKIHDFIVSLPKGYDSMVDNRGLKLSGGEKQRLSIARVLLKKPHLIIFDEATSSLDSIVENEIQEAIEPILASQTSIVIAHRLSTILSCDRIMVVEKGVIKAMGKHEDLLITSSLYKKLFNTQFKVF